MTIKEFAELCSCSTQTLRYYDRIGLLKPAEVDDWTGYRRYEAAQAVEFVKIKNLQAADFTIGEIKDLLGRPDGEVYDAFSAKIAAQRQKLERIEEIQKTYLKEKNYMEKIVQSMSDFILRQLRDYEGLREFGMTPEDGPRVVSLVREYLEESLRRDTEYSQELRLTVNGEVFRGAEEIAEKLDTLMPAPEDQIYLLDKDEEEDIPWEEYETLWEAHGWSVPVEFLNDLPPMETGGNYFFRFRLNEQKYRWGDVSFPMFMLGAMTLRKGKTPVLMSCDVDRSDDGENHFVMLRKK